MATFAVRCGSSQTRSCRQIGKTAGKWGPIWVCCHAEGGQRRMIIRASTAAVCATRLYPLRTLAADRGRAFHSLPGEHDRNRTPVLDHLPGRGQLAGARINAEYDHAVALFVRRIEEMAGRIEADEARVAALGWLPADHAQ